MRPATQLGSLVLGPGFYQPQVTAADPPEKGVKNES